MPRVDARVLVVDDDEAIRNLVTEVLTAEGYRVFAAADGDAALAITQRNGPFSLILLDVLPSGLGAHQFVAGYRLGPLPHARIVLFTALTSSDAATDAEALGAAGVLRKPFDLEALLTVAARFSHHPQDSARHGSSDERAVSSLDAKEREQHRASVGGLQRDLADVSDALAATRVENWALLQVEASRPLNTDETARAARLRREQERLRFELARVRRELALLHSRGRSHS